MSLPIYADFDKAPKDLVSKDFDVDKYVLKIKSGGPKGLGFNTTLNFLDQFSKTSSKVAGDYSHPSGFAVDKLEVDNGKITSETSLTGVAPGLKLEYKGVVGDKKAGDSGALSFSYKVPSATLTGEIDLIHYKDLKLSGVTNVAGVTAGAAATIGLPSSDGKAANLLTDFSLGVAYAVPKSFFFSLRTKKLTDFKFGATYELQRNVSLGATVDYPSNAVTLGGVYKCNPDTVVKAKLDSEGKIAASVKQSLEKKASVTGAVSLNLKNIGGGALFGVTASLG